MAKLAQLRTHQLCDSGVIVSGGQMQLEAFKLLTVFSYQVCWFLEFLFGSSCLCTRLRADTSL